jgi:hypothetical protein
MIIPPPQVVEIQEKFQISNCQTFCFLKSIKICSAQKMCPTSVVYTVLLYILIIILLIIILLLLLAIQPASLATCKSFKLECEVLLSIFHSVVFTMEKLRLKEISVVPTNKNNRQYNIWGVVPKSRRVMWMRISRGRVVQVLSIWVNCECLW